MARGLGTDARRGGARTAPPVSRAARAARPRKRAAGVSGQRVDRALADLVGGWEGGATLFELACARLARLAGEFAEEPMRFNSHPRGMLHRLEVACADALQTVEVACELHEAMDHELPAEERAAEIVDILLDRARRVATERQGFQLPAAARAPAVGYGGDAG